MSFAPSRTIGYASNTIPIDVSIIFPTRNGCCECRRDIVCFHFQEKRIEKKKFLLWYLSLLFFKVFRIHSTSFACGAASESNTHTDTQSSQDTLAHEWPNSHSCPQHKTIDHKTNRAQTNTSDAKCRRTTTPNKYKHTFLDTKIRGQVQNKTKVCVSGLANASETRRQNTMELNTKWQDVVEWNPIFGVMLLVAVRCQWHAMADFRSDTNAAPQTRQNAMWRLGHGEMRCCRLHRQTISNRNK